MNRCSQAEERIIIRPPAKYADKPNLWRLACELSTFKRKYAAADMLLAMVQIMRSEHDQQ